MERREGEEKRRIEELERENEDLKRDIENRVHSITNLSETVVEQSYREVTIEGNTILNMNYEKATIFIGNPMSRV